MGEYGSLLGLSLAYKVSWYILLEHHSVMDNGLSPTDLNMLSNLFLSHPLSHF